MDSGQSGQFAVSRVVEDKGLAFVNASAVKSDKKDVVVLLMIMNIVMVNLVHTGLAGTLGANVVQPVGQVLN